MTQARVPTPNPIEQAGAIPYRRCGDRLEFCLITSSSGKRWGFPKGIIDPDETFVETALKEAEEEAGLLGHVVGEPLGSYQYHKWDTSLTVIVVLMEVAHSRDDWPEAYVRRRRWVTAEQARELLSQPALQELLDAAVERLPDRRPSD